MFTSKSITTVNPNCQNCKNINCFVKNHFSIEQIKYLNNLKKTEILKKNDFVYKKGSKPKSVYMLYDGCVEIINKNPKGNKKDIYFAEPGELFGYRSLFAEEVHNTSAKVYENSKVCKLLKDDFFDLFVKDKKLAIRFMKFLSIQLKRRQKKLEQSIDRKK